MKVYDYESIVYAFLNAQHEWRRHGRVARKTYLRLRCLMSQKVVNRMTGQLLDYHNPMSTMKPVQDLLDLPEWRKAWAWAQKGDEPRRRVALEAFSFSLGADPEKVQAMMDLQERQVGLGARKGIL